VIDTGDPLPIQTVEVKDAAGALANAGAMTLTVTLPDGTTATPGFTNPSTGRYVPGTYITVQAGRHVARWVGTGVNSSTYVEAFDVRPADAAGIVSVADMVDILRLQAPTAVDKERLRSLIDAATNIVERGTRDFRGCGPVIRRTEIENAYPSSGLLLLLWRPVIAVTSVTPYGGAALNPAYYTVDPVSGIVSATPYTPLFASAVYYTVVYEVGRVVIPGSLIEGTAEVVRHLWESRYRGPATMPLADDEFGASSGAFALPYKAADLLRPWEQIPAFA